MRLRTIIIALIALAAVGTGTAVAATSGQTIPHSKSFKLNPGQTKTFNVKYFDANIAGYAYSGRVNLQMPSKGKKPSLKLVHIKKKGKTHGGNDFSATVQNSNKSGTAPVTVKITAKTVIPGFY